MEKIEDMDLILKEVMEEMANKRIMEAEKTVELKRVLEKIETEISRMAFKLQVLDPVTEEYETISKNLKKLVDVYINIYNFLIVR